MSSAADSSVGGSKGDRGSEASRGRWVRIQWVVLEAGERAPQIPEDTARVPLEARASGWLDQESAAVGEEATIRTPTGRRLTGRLIEIDPAPGHGFGMPVAELLAIGPELRRRLAERQAVRGGAADGAGAPETPTEDAEYS